MSGSRPLDIVIFGLAITSAWGNGHATTYRALVRALAARGHRVRFFERDMPWYADNRDLPSPSYCELRLYRDLQELAKLCPGELRADLIIVGSYIPQGTLVADWIMRRACAPVVFYDIDTPVTLAAVSRGECEYLTPELIGRFDGYLSFAGGPILSRLRTEFGARCVQAFYCSVEPRDYYPTDRLFKPFDLGYLGTYSADRQDALERLLLEPARRSRARFCVAGAQYPDAIAWPQNVSRTEHLAPAAHRDFYNSQRLTLNITRADMVAQGYAPSVRLFEAAACGVPIISDEWRGLEEFFLPGEQILVARSTEDVLRFLRQLDQATLERIAASARHTVLAKHTAEHRAAELEEYVTRLVARAAPRAPALGVANGGNQMFAGCES